jgi:hypothetical protein
VSLPIGNLQAHLVVEKCLPLKQPWPAQGMQYRSRPRPRRLQGISTRGRRIRLRSRLSCLSSRLSGWRLSGHSALPTATKVIRIRGCSRDKGGDGKCGADQGMHGLSSHWFLQVYQWEAKPRQLCP